MNNAILLTGSNINEPLLQLHTAMMALERYGTVKMTSSIYKTAPWGTRDQPDFYNQVIVLKTELEADKLLDEIFEIEKSMGRIRTERNAPRIIDIDILFFNDSVIDKPGLTVPHPAIPERRFVLVPLSEIMPFYKHPVLQKTVSQLLEECEDTLAVERF